MLSNERENIETRIERTFARILDLVLNEGRSVIVDAPPGSGKTELLTSVIRAVAFLGGARTAVVAPRSTQVYDLCRRLGRVAPPASIQVLLARDRTLPEELQGDPALLPAVTRVGDINPAARVVIGTARKFYSAITTFRAGEYAFLACDESFQLAYRDLAPLLKLSSRYLLVGDPGQLSPFFRVDISRFEALALEARVHWAAPRVLRRRAGSIVEALPASRRLCSDTVALIQPAFYPRIPFVSATPDTERRLAFQQPSSGDALDRALDLCAEGASIVVLLLPMRDDTAVGLDTEVTDLMSAVVQRMLERGAEWVGKRRLEPTDIGVIDPHVAEGAAIRRALRARGISTQAVLVETPEAFQGLERLVTVVHHPLSGKRALGAFDLECGRWCVMLSRHLLACVIVARSGVATTLARHEHQVGDRPLGGEDAEWNGWRTHATLWTELERRGRVVSVYMQ